jgi:two-component system, sensor histidine kinase
MASAAGAVSTTGSGTVVAAGATPADAAPSRETPEDAGLGTLPDIVQSSYDYMPAAMAGYVSGIGVVSILFWELTSAPVFLTWLSAFGVMLVIRLAVMLRYRSATITTRSDWRHWLLLNNAGTLVAATLWGVTGLVFYTQGKGIQQTALIVLIYTYSVVAIPVLSIQPRLYLAFVGLSFLPLIGRIFYEGDAYSNQLGSVLLLMLVMTTLVARNFRQTLQRVIELKLRGEELLVQLRVEKKAADAARREAEVANRAKTQFFAAASHDLRQPLHAMGLFAEALRQKSHDEEVSQLVNSINASVDALEGLFSELLDITRIDTGGVEVHDSHFEVGEILRKLRLHFEPTAFEKGLSLRLRGGAKVVFADPLLVERILRNLVSNAIRYTNDGTVLVGARRRGDKVLLQVMDTGLGIRDTERARIFEEFYQVPNTDAVLPEQRKGLGLGLAIVKRLADLMHAPLTLSSIPGKGSVFTLELPAGKAPRAESVKLPSKGPLGLTLEGRLVVVVEDEPVVRGGLEVLLKSWGASLVSFDSVAQTRAWAAAADPAVVKPDLLIVDYRLEEGLSGVDAIASLRARFGAGLPAIVVTGSTMSGHENEAHDGDFHLLIKPVLPNKLRAMIAFKLGQR